MQYIKKLPLLFALFAAILSGITGLARSMAHDRILLQMIISMVIFYAIGIYVRYNFTKIHDQVKEKKEEEANMEKAEHEEEKEVSRDKKESIIEDFEPLKISKFIKEKLEQPVEE